MIGKEKLLGCSKEILVLADFLEILAKKKKSELIITSGKRSPEENSKAKGSPTSAHLVGNAMDWCFKDLHVFRYTGEIFELCLLQAGAFKGVSELELCRDVNGTQHIHTAFYTSDKLRTFTGIYYK